MRQIFERGYEATTIRSVASAVGVAVGTVYNYFPSKDMLVASFMLEDWIDVIKRLKESKRVNPEGYLSAIYSSLAEFSEKYSGVFSSEAAKRAYGSESRVRHAVLRGQITELLLPISQDVLTAEFVAESLICWSSENRPFSDIYPIIKKIII